MTKLSWRKDGDCHELRGTRQNGKPGPLQGLVFRSSPYLWAGCVVQLRAERLLCFHGAQWEAKRCVELRLQDPKNHMSVRQTLCQEGEPC